MLDRMNAPPGMIDRDSPRVLRHEWGLAGGRTSVLMPKGSNQLRWREAIVLTVCLWLFVLLLFLPIIVPRYRDASWTTIALDCSTVLVSILFALGMFVVFRRTAKMPQGRRVAVLIAVVITTAVLNIAFDLIFQVLIATRVDEAFAALPANAARAYPSMLNYILVFGVNMAMFQVSSARRAELKQQLQLSRALASAQQAQLAALRYQLNPHFLFNALNSISALIVTKRNADAERMTDKLSSFLRNSLTAEPGELVPLEEELSLTEEYLEIESVRFGDRLAINVDCSDHACAALIPSFLVQPLVENAVKHGVARARGRTEIEIKGDMDGETLRICVSNSLPPTFGNVTTPPRGNSSGVGLENVRRRIASVYGETASLEAGPKDDRFVATISIPNVRALH